MSDAVEVILDSLRGRVLPDHRCVHSKPVGPRPDAAAWTALAFSAADTEPDLRRALLRTLRAAQGADGRVGWPEPDGSAIWPTAVCGLAWRVGGAEFEEPARRALNFLQQTMPKTYDQREGLPVSHDTTLRGWGWVTDTHCWIEPTTMVVLLHEAFGRGSDERCAEARVMILDRQLPSGGWNYGNKHVFDTELEPMPETTGMALAAIAGYVERAEVTTSLEFLARKLQFIRSPLGLTWLLLGARAWALPVPEPGRLLQESLERQDVVGPFDTDLLAGLILAERLPHGILEWVRTFPLESS